MDRHMIDHNEPLEKMLSSESLGIKGADDLASDIQAKIGLFKNYSDSRVARLVGELEGYLSELIANCDGQRREVINKKVDQIFKDLGEPRET